MEVIINSIPPSNNKFMGNGQMGANYQYQEKKKEWALLILATFGNKRPKKPIEKAVITLHYRFKDKRRRDPDNYSGKMILDGLTKAGIIEDDSFSNIKLVLEAEFGCDKAQTIITIEEE